MFPARITNKAFTIRENIPSVTTVIGNVRILTIGLIYELISPKTTAKSSAPTGVTLTPGIKYAEIIIAIEDTIQWVMFIVVV